MKKCKRKIAALIALATSSSVLVSLQPISVQANDLAEVTISKDANSITIGNDFIERKFSIENGKVSTTEIDNKRAGIEFTPGVNSEEFLIEPLDKKNNEWQVIEVSSEETSSENGAASNLIDGDASTIWHTKYSGGVDEFPHYVVIDLGEEKNLEGFSYLPRSNGNNGDLKDYEFYVSNDLDDFGEPVSSGTFRYDGKKEIKVNFESEKQGRYIKLVGTNAVNGQNFASGAELNILEVGAEEVVDTTSIKTSDLTLNDIIINDSATGKGKHVEFDFAPFEKNGVNWDVDMNIVMEDGDHFMRKYLEIKTDDPNAAIDYIDLEHLVVDEDTSQSWSRPDMDPAFISGYHMALGQPIYIEGMFFGSELPATDNRIVQDKGEDLAHIKYFSGKKFENLEKNTEGEFVTWQTVAGSARSTDQSVIQSDFFDYIKTISTRTDFRKQYNSWYDHMMNITAENIEESFYEIEKGLSQYGVEPVDSYVVDDGWNDYDSDFWSFNSKFPNELYDSTQLTEKFSSNFGLWLGPRGGYNYNSKFGRQIEAAGKGGYNPAGGDICTGHPEYLKNLTTLFTDYMDRFDINYWKLDGFNLSPCPVKDHGHATGGPNGMYFTTEHWENWTKVFDVMRDVREEDGKDLFLNLTCYINPSPWYLQWANTLWLQNSNDVGFSGGAVDGSMMDSMLTYRDDKYFDFVQTRELQFPLANIYNHDPIYGNTNKYNGQTVTMNTDQFRKYLFMLMTRGTAFWELYYSYNLMDSEKWMVSADVLKWGEDNFHILRNAKLLGDTPKSGNVYGYSAWEGNNGIISLRNPSNEKKSYTITLDRLIGVKEDMSNLTKSTVYPYGVLDEERTYSYGDEITIELEPHEIAIWQFGEKDEKAPSIVNIKSIESNKIQVEFDERIIADKANYTIEGNAITNATILADYRTVELDLSSNLEDGKEYTLKLNDVSDLGNNKTAINEKFNFYGDDKIIEILDKTQLNDSENITEGSGPAPGIKSLSLDNKAYSVKDSNSFRGSEDFGVSLMFKTSDTGSLLNQGDEYKLSVNNDGKLEFTVKGVTVISKNIVNNNSWNNVTALREKNGMLKLYINGKLDSSSYDETKASELVNSQNITLGSPDFKGDIANVIVRNTAFGFDEVKTDAESIPTGSYTVGEAKVTTIKGVLPELPESVILTYENGTKVNVGVKWDALNEADFNQPGTVNIYGTIAGVDEKAIAVVKVLEKTQNDEFNSGELSDIWTIEREVNDNWSLTENEGKLTIKGTAGFNDYKDRNDNDNVFLQERFSDDYVITTKLEGKPSAGYQSAGLLAYVNNDNYVRISRKSIGSNILSFTYEVNGVPQHVEIADPISGEEIYLSLEKKGNQYSSYYSVDGEVWNTLSQNIEVDLADHKVGLYATNGTGPQYTAKFDNFRYLPYSPTTSIQSINEVSVETKVGVLPKLPAKVVLNLADGTTSNALVNWESFDQDKYSKPGTFSVNGIVEGTEKSVEAKITVTSDEVAPPTGEKPNKVSSLKVIDKTTSSVKLEWEAPTNTSIKKYKIYKDGKELIETTDTSLVIDDLKANTMYSFKVIAISEDDKLSKPASITSRTEKNSPSVVEKVSKFFNNLF